MPGESLIGLFLVRDTPRPPSNALPVGISLTAEHILTAFWAVRNTRTLTSGEREREGEGLKYRVDANGKKRGKTEGGKSEEVISALRRRGAEYMNTGSNQSERERVCVVPVRYLNLQFVCSQQ